jgi:hypothetical protein
MNFNVHLKYKDMVAAVLGTSIRNCFCVCQLWEFVDARSWWYTIKINDALITRLTRNDLLYIVIYFHYLWTFWNHGDGSNAFLERRRILLKYDILPGYIEGYINCPNQIRNDHMQKAWRKNDHKGDQKLKNAINTCASMTVVYFTYL